MGQLPKNGWNRHTAKALQKLELSQILSQEPLAGTLGGTPMSTAPRLEPGDILTPEQLAERLQVGVNWVYEKSRARAITTAIPCRFSVAGLSPFFLAGCVPGYARTIPLDNMIQTYIIYPQEAAMREQKDYVFHSGKCCYVRYYDDVLQPDGTVKRVQVCKQLSVEYGGDYRTRRSVQRSFRSCSRRSIAVCSIHRAPCR